MSHSSDTIVAISTPAGVGGVALLRVSGADSLACVLAHLNVDVLLPRHATYCHFETYGSVVDDVVATFFQSPSSYTGEDVVELACHGSVYVQQTLVQTFLNDGLRMAEPGEFTLRAFKNGKMNLSQAESVADVIDATTRSAHELAMSQMRGGYAKRLSELRKQMVDMAALIELELDFSQEDVEFADRGRLQTTLDQLSKEVSHLCNSFQMGNAIKEGVPIVIVGSPNVGKSSLLNALLDEERAIVSDVPGTTRDTVEALLIVDGIKFRIIDTAGIHQTADTVELMGIDRARRAAQQARIVVEVEDVSLGLDYTAHSVHHDDKKHIRVLNKCDLDKSAYKFDGAQIGDTLFICTSATQGMGIEPLKQTIASMVRADVQPYGNVLITNSRHYEALLRVGDALTHVKQGMDDGVPTDLLMVDLRDALYHLGTITGEVTSNEILSSVFSRFCVGK
ncbi:MAG: tRNA uridine-5-carboxymethylaminomethyl(34) synthesis GTPase MnmE [Bacteroidales bacterium]|nr:tRNA uridine-5-carboxymethylaminomethyl(34) synthesis GTPase MnmE [Bacteroidales bacterium]